MALAAAAAPSTNKQQRLSVDRWLARKERSANNAFILLGVDYMEQRRRFGGAGIIKG